jgi:hypothetical protein
MHGLGRAGKAAELDHPQEIAQLAPVHRFDISFSDC